MAPWLTPYELQIAATGIDVIQDGPWVELFTNVNPAMTRSVLWESTFVFLGTGGDCFWKLAGRNGKVEPTEIPQRIWPRSRDGWKPSHDKERGIVNGWKFEGINFEGKPIKEDFELFQVVHCKYFNPHDQHFGQSQIEAVQEEIGQYFRSGRWNTKFFQNGASPGGCLVFQEGLTIRSLPSWIRNRRSAKTRQSYATTKTVRKTIVAITGKRATLRLPMKRSRRPIESSSSRRITRAPIRRLSRRAAASPMSTRRPVK